MKHILTYLRSYGLFSLALASLLGGSVLVLVGQTVASAWLLAIVSAFETIPLLIRMGRDIHFGKYGIDILAATAIIFSIVLGQFWAAIIIVIMLTGGESLEDFAATRARSELKDLLKRAPQMAHVIRRRRILDVRVGDVHVNEKIAIRPGEVVPVDAIILEGSGSFDESSLTGESLPQTKEFGDHILSGTLCQDGAITARTIRSAKNSQYQQIIRLVQSASAHPAPFVRLADHYSIPFTIVAYIIAGFAWAISGQPIRFLEVIVVATPCPLLLATPIALIAGMSRAARDGIIIKTGTALEQLAQAKTIAFDKTGTLTRGTPVVEAVYAFQDFKEEMVLVTAASLERSSNHVLARAIVTAAADEKLPSQKARNLQEIAGMGLHAIINGKEAIVGRLSFMQQQHVTLPRQFNPDAVAQTATYVAIGGSLAGYITFKDELRPEADSTLQTIKKLGIKHILMVTGDNLATAKAIAKRLGITDIWAGALPGDKLRAVESITSRPVAFVGDGVNDAPVLAAADVGVALGARGSTAASESADVVIMQDSVRHVALAIMIARRAFSIARQSIFIGIGISVALMLIFASGRFSPVLGAIVQEAVDVIVIFNALRAHGGEYR